MAATIAVAQYDIKRVLAFSTISQLGFMVAALGIGAYVAAAFHLLTHAFFKALLFLGSGSVIHGVEHGHHHVHAHGHDDCTVTQLTGGHGSRHAHAHGHSDHAEPEFDPQDMRNMGGLRTKMPITFSTFLIGGLALAGFPFITAGFWSKDEIFADAFHHGMTSRAMGWHAGVRDAGHHRRFMTAFYTMRQIAMTFFGKPRTEAAEHASESAPAMTIPLIVLAVFALFIGFINIPTDFPVFGPLLGEGAYWLENFLEEWFGRKARNA